MRITGGEEGHALSKVKNASFGNDSLGEFDVVNVGSGFLLDEDVGAGKFEGCGESGFGGGGVGLGEFGVRIEVVEEEAGLGACELKNVLMVISIVYIARGKGQEAVRSTIENMMQTLNIL